MFYPVSNNNQVNKPGGGTHWSLLVYCRSKNVYYHHDPIYPINGKYAFQLMHKISSADNSFGTSKADIEPPQQKNGYDCGPYVMLFANKIADNLINGTSPNKFEVSKHEASSYREELKKKILLEMKKASVEPVTERYENNRRTRKNRKDSIGQINSNNRKHKTNHKPKIKDVCGKWINHKCWKGENCTLEHPIMCESDVHLTKCGSKENPCNLYHPQVCTTYYEWKECSWGERCKFRHLFPSCEERSKFRHILNNLHGHSHRDNRHRQDSHYKHHDGHYNQYHRYGDQDNYGHRDGGRQNKRELHNQNNHNEYNNNNAYGSRVNSHQGLYTHLSKQKLTQNIDNRQSPQINNSNQNVDFLGCQRNPMDWPPLTEEKLLGTLRGLIQVELAKWGPTRR